MYDSLRLSLGAGRAGNFLIGATCPQQLQDFGSDHAILKQFENSAIAGRPLPRQLRLRSGVLGRCQRVSRPGPSLGDSTSAGAENSQAATTSASKSLLTLKITQPLLSGNLAGGEGIKCLSH